MFMDFRGDWPPQGGPAPQPRPRRLSKRGERVVGALVGVNVLFLLLAPIGGATLIEPVIAWLLAR